MVWPALLTLTLTPTPTPTPTLTLTLTPTLPLPLLLTRFGQLALKANEQTALSVSRGQGGFGKMLVKLDGTVVEEGAGQVVSEKP